MITAPRIVIDTTVWLSGMHRPSGPNGAILAMAQHRKIVAITSSWIMEEVLRHLARFKLSSWDHIATLHDVKPESIELSETEIAQWEKIHRKDRHVVAAAVKGRAKVIVTSDARHLLNNPHVLAEVEHVFSPEICLTWLRSLFENQ